MSPRAAGQPWRLIPAHAGKTALPLSTPSGSSAHPRSRGENTTSNVKCRAVWGSSPLTRGKPRWLFRRRDRARLIPAHAGKTPRRRQETSDPQAHPRSRGENTPVGSQPPLSYGSSPLTRGKRVGGPGANRRFGLIPAHAGKTESKNSYPESAQAHPRSRGENGPSCLPLLMLQGSSPLTRGKPRGGQRPRRFPRLIPAHAGKTGPSRPRACRATAHPRSRGENPRLSGRLQRGGGSSPLTRGKHQVTILDSRDSRLIPAHAGKTVSSARHSPFSTAHPRSRGENSATNPR